MGYFSWGQSRRGQVDLENRSDGRRELEEGSRCSDVLEFLGLDDLLEEVHGQLE